MRSYEIIAQHYGNQQAKRSKVPLMNHINEGLKILQHLQASPIVQQAYCLHPLLQSDEAFNANRANNFDGVPTHALLLAMEYRRVANSYLSHMKKEDFAEFPCLEIKQMLIADKLQNYKDFMRYHHGTHPRSSELYHYFWNWFELLDIEYKEWADFDFSSHKQKNNK